MIWLAEGYPSVKDWFPGLISTALLFFSLSILLLPGVESFDYVDHVDHVVPSKKALNLVAGMSELSPEERNFCLKIASNWTAKRTQNTPRSEEDHSAKTYLEILGRDYEMARGGPKQEGFGCPLCVKSFNRLSTLK